MDRDVGTDLYECVFPRFPGSRAGAIIAGCWATMMHVGHDGYVDATRRIIETTKYIESKYAVQYHEYI